MKALKRFGWKNIWEDIIWELSAQLWKDDIKTVVKEMGVSAQESPGAAAKCSSDGRTGPTGG
jgi:hypothetical protein